MDDTFSQVCHIEDLLSQAERKDQLFCSGFLSESEQAEVVASLGLPPEASGIVRDVPYLFYGGRAESERRRLYFLPSGLSPEEFLAGEEAGISILHVEPRNRKFAETLSHRDFLGALMSLGYRRDVFGDLLLEEDSKGAYLFLLKKAEEDVRTQLLSVRHTPVMANVVSSCPLSERFETLILSLSSFRIDTVVREVFHLPRKESQRLIATGLVSIGMKPILENAKVLKPGDRVSVRTKGKFVLEKESGPNAKGRYHAEVKKYA